MDTVKKELIKTGDKRFSSGLGYGGGYRRTGYEALVYAVVELAVKDYKKALRRCSARERAGLQPRLKDMWLKEDCEVFFMSQDFASLTGADGLGIMCTVEDRVLSEMR